MKGNKTFLVIFDDIMDKLDLEQLEAIEKMVLSGITKRGLKITLTVEPNEDP